MPGQSPSNCAGQAVTCCTSNYFFLLKADKRAPTSVRKFGDEQLETIPLPNGVNVTIKRAALANGLQVGSNTCKRRRSCGRACGGTGGGSSCRRR